jgi:TRAP-type mannitol/chloroaromatic compound transport system permease small subunit
MQAALAFTRFVDEFNRRVAVIAIWLVLIVSMVGAVNALITLDIQDLMAFSRQYSWIDSTLGAFLRWYGRYANVFIEIQIYMFCALVMLGAPWVLKLNEHVRVDLFYGHTTERKRTWIDLICGVLFLIPFCVILLYLGFHNFRNSIGETSANSVLPIWPFTIWLPIGFFLLLLQAIAELIKCVAALTTNYHREHAYEKPVQ